MKFITDTQVSHGSDSVELALSLHIIVLKDTDSHLVKLVHDLRLDLVAVEVVGEVSDGSCGLLDDSLILVIDSIPEDIHDVSMIAREVVGLDVSDDRYHTQG